MVQSTFVPSLISIEAFFIVSQQFEIVTGGFSVKTAIFHNMLMGERVKESSAKAHVAQQLWEVIVSYLRS
jgi:hypothetical protein